MNDQNGGETLIRKRLQSKRIEIRKRSEVEKMRIHMEEKHCDEEGCARGKTIGFTGTAVQSPDEICLPREWGILYDKNILKKQCAQHKNQLSSGNPRAAMIFFLKTTSC